MKSILNKSIIQKPKFEKIAEYVLPKDTSIWNDEIIDQFYKEVDFLPQGVNIDTVIDNIEENKGYAKGSVVAWVEGKQVNFPVIVKDYKLSPFDIFVVKKNNEYKYDNLTKGNLDRALVDTSIGVIDDKAKNGANSVKTPGGISQKSSIDVSSYNEDDTNSILSKVSSYHASDFKHLEKIAKKKGVLESFSDTTGDLISNVINLKDSDKVVPVSHKKVKMDPRGAIKAKRMITVLDSEMLDTNDLKPVVGNTPCEIRVMIYPTMSDFIDRGANAAARLRASQSGKQIVGLSIKYVDSYDYGQEIKDCNIRQMFLSISGKYNIRINNDKPLYGYPVVNTAGTVEKMLRILNEKIGAAVETKGNIKHSTADKIIDPNVKHRGANSTGNGLLCVFGTGDDMLGVSFGGSFVKKSVNGTLMYIGGNKALIPANVASIQKVKRASGVYDSMISKNSSIYLIPESSVLLNLDEVHNINYSDILTPSDDIKDIYKRTMISNANVSLGETGYKVTGSAVKPLQKLAGFTDATNLSGAGAMTVLQTMGMHPSDSHRALKDVLEGYVTKTASDVNIYGLDQSYINEDAFKPMEKIARVGAIYDLLSKRLNVDLIKEASVIDDPESVEAMLSLNFINKDNIEEFVGEIGNLEKVKSKLCNMLVTSRMGLTELDEGALKSAINGLDKTIIGLTDIKTATTPVS